MPEFKAHPLGHSEISYVPADATKKSGKKTSENVQVISSQPLSSDGKIIVIISDTGSGIPEDVKDKIFDPFFTTKGSLGRGQISGTGLGLSISYGIIKSHGGDVSAESDSDKGTTIAIKFPLKGVLM